MKITAGVFASFDDMCWTLPSERMNEIAHKIRYGEYDLYWEPEATAPYLRAPQPGCSDAK